jgi:hypothetical protein
VRQPRSQPLKRRQVKKSEKVNKKKKSQFVYEIRIISGALFSFEPVRDSVQVSFILLEDTRSKSLRGTAVSIEAVSF